MIMKREEFLGSTSYSQTFSCIIILEIDDRLWMFIKKFKCGKMIWDILNIY